MKSWTAGLTFATLAILSVSLPALAAETPTHEDVSKVKEFLFVQNATAGSFVDGRLSLVESGPILFFSDRPYRIFGHSDPEHFIDAWAKGDNSFATDPPNAVLSLLGEQVESFVVVISDPQYNDGVVSYAVEVDEGTIPAMFGQASLFIDDEFWAAAGGLAVGRMTARRAQEREAAAYQQGAAAQDQKTYYQAQPAAAPAASSASPDQQLEQLKKMLDQGLITQDEYNTKKAQILKSM